MFRSDTRLLTALAVSCAVTCGVAPRAARAEPPTPRLEDKDALGRARAEYVAALDHVKSARWGEALAAFERSSALRPHVLTTYNIGACERALAHYTRARAALAGALAADEAGPKRELPASFAADARTWLGEIDRLLVHATVTLSPPDATLLVDGAPLSRSAAFPGALVAGVGKVEAEARTPGPRFEVVLDPGTHLFSISRPGFSNAIVTKTFDPGTRVDLALDARSLPATIHIAANQPAAVVTVDDVDVGLAPVQLSRPAGSYRVAVRKAGFVPYLAQVNVAPGDRPQLQASLAAETTPLLKKAWFWAVAAGVVAGVATASYIVARPAPERPAPDGGGLGWAVTIPGQ